jgi:hypothetical protein
MREMTAKAGLFTKAVVLVTHAARARETRNDRMLAGVCICVVIESL